MSAVLDRDADDALEIAAGHLKAGRYRAVAAICEDVLTGNPRHLGALNLFATYKAQTGEIEAAQEILEEATRIDDRFAGTYNNLGALHLALGRLEEARIAIERAARLDPDDSETRANLAALALKSGERDHALALLERCVREAPESAHAWYNLSQARLQTGDRKGAEAALRRCLELDPGKAEAWNNLGNLLGESGRVAEAVKALETALLHDPESLVALGNLTDLQIRIGRLDEAERHMKRLKVLQPRSPILPLTEGRLHMAAGRYDAAEASFLDAMRRLPDAPLGAFSHALLMRHTGRPAEARRSAAAALELADDFMPVRSLAAELALAAGDLDAAWEALRRLPLPGAAAFESPAGVDGRVIAVDCGREVAWSVRAARFLPGLVAAGVTVRLDGDARLRALVETALPAAPGDAGAAADAPALAVAPWHLPLLAGATAEAVVATPPVYLSVPAEIDAMVTESLARLKRPLLLVCLPGPAEPAPDAALVGFWEAALTVLPRTAGSTVVVGVLPPASRAKPTAFVRDPDPAELASLARVADAVVSMDGWPAEVAAALGRPVHVAVPCHGAGVWGETGETTPWYPSARIYRPAPPDDWTGAAESLGRAMHETLGARTLDGDPSAP